MLRSWKNLFVVLLLALLQGIAPLLHAHVHDFSMPGKIHFHALEIGVPQGQADTGVYQIKSHQADSAAIGMENAGKNDQDRLVIAPPVLGAASSAFSLLCPRAPPLYAPAAAAAFPPDPHFLPPSHAPPGANFS